MYVNLYIRDKKISLEKLLYSSVSPNMTEDKVAVVTGANRGIGFAIVQGLCELQFPGHVYLTSRDPVRGQAAVLALNSIGLRPNYHQLDVTDVDSVQRFKEHLEQRHGGLDILVNNAAINYQKDAKESFGEQAERTLKVNYEGVVLVTRTLWPLLREGARVVNMTSTAGHLSRICGYEPHAETLRAHLSSSDLDQPMLDRLMREFVHAAKLGRFRQMGWPNSPYSVSKVGVAALTGVLQRELEEEGRDVIVNCVHPGFVRTALSRNRGVLTPQQGARLPVQLCMLPRRTIYPHGDFIWCDGSILDWRNGRTPRTPVVKPHDLVILEWSAAASY